MDDLDRAKDWEEQWLEERIRAARGDIPQGQPGDCETCGEWSQRLINGMCAPCRDKYGVE